MEQSRDVAEQLRDEAELRALHAEQSRDATEALVASLQARLAQLAPEDER